MSRWTSFRDSAASSVGGFLGGGGLSSLLPTGGVPMASGLPGMSGGEQQMGGGGGLGGTKQTGDQGEIGYPQKLSGLMELLVSNKQPTKMNLISRGGEIL